MNTFLTETGETATNISIRSNDTDVFVLLLYHVHNITPKPNVCVDIGLFATTPGIM